jgi:multicomponent Na+:H+ antiporter subunit F
MNAVDPWLLSALLLLLLSLAGGLFRALRGPTLQDRMLSVQLLGSGGVALLLLLAVLLELPALLDVSLVLAMLAVVTAVALTRREVSGD